MGNTRPRASPRPEPGLCRNTWAAQNDEVIPSSYSWLPSLVRMISTFTWVSNAAIATIVSSTGASNVTTPPTATPAVSGTSRSTSSSFLIADYEAADISLLDEFFGLIDEFACGYLYLLGPSVLFFFAFVDAPVRFATHRSSPLLLVPP